MDAKLLYEKPIKIELVGYNLFVGGNQHTKSVRTLGQMKSTLARQTNDSPTIEMYYMYRSVYRKDDMRFDITVLPPLDIGGENTKTYGHYHPRGEEGLAYPELYQVLKGHALFVLQKKNRSGSVDVIMVDANEGDVVLMPPGYGHVSINKGTGDLVLSNVVYDKFESIYSEYQQNAGAAFYYFSGGIEQNSNYIVQKSEHIDAKELNSRYKLPFKDLLPEFYAEPHKFEFLKKPSLLAQK